MREGWTDGERKALETSGKPGAGWGTVNGCCVISLCNRGGDPSESESVIAFAWHERGVSVSIWADE